jgi:hypothetical protein
LDYFGAWLSQFITCDMLAYKKMPNKALHLTPYRAGFYDGGCISRASKLSRDMLDVEGGRE